MADFVTSAGGDASSAPAAGPEPGPDRKPDSLQIGVSRPPLTLDDLPTPEEVFDKPRIGFREIVTVVLGPSMIALGASLGSGEWLLGPLAFGKYGFLGLGWLIVISGILQVLYNVENARYVIATVEDSDSVRRVDTLAAMAQAAAAHGTALAVEFMMFTASPTLVDAVAVIEAAGEPNVVVEASACTARRGSRRRPRRGALALVPPRRRRRRGART